MSSHQAMDLKFLDSLYEQFKEDPARLDPSWQAFFRMQEFPTTSSQIEDEAEAYRRDGHLLAKINPIALNAPDVPPSLQGKHDPKLHAIYCGSIGYEYKNLDNPALEAWIQERIENAQVVLTPTEKQYIFEYLNKSELFETFLHTKFVGQKRFSLEGAETLIPMLGLLIEKGAESTLKEVVLGMAHRGRLNVLSNILNKSHDQIFSEFDEHHIPHSAEGEMGDVKYHKGFTSDILKTHSGKKIKITLVPNPSHLESVDAVVEGEARAKQFLQHDEKDRQAIIPILIHGDAAISGQGVVYETLELYNLPGYSTGGTIHFIVNNQVGFTTAPRDLKSTRYCTDIAHAFGFPVFHVNAEDPEACVQVALLALEIRQKFHCDVFIDLNCYRKYGHNESDEPAFTQPLEYQLIKNKRSIREIYRDQLLQEKIVQKEAVDKMETDFKQKMQETHAKGISHQVPEDLMEVPNPHLLFDPFPTGIDQEILKKIAEKMSKAPDSFHIHPKLENLLKERLKMVMDAKPMDWGMAELLAYGTLVWEGIPVRFSGQDSCRGTFTHRHAIWLDQKTGAEYFPLAHLKAEQGRFEIINSPLSEFAILGFEYGYSVACPEGLTIWEAQFGDFGNGAQVMIDQYIASGEQKWGQKSGITLFLPHGYEGQGPEHSSARMERFLTLCGHDNMQIVNPTTPAQLFHLLRRQVLRQLRKPLVVFTPKGLLRYPPSFSRLEELTDGYFHEILDDPTQPLQATRLILCCGRVYYDLLAQREKKQDQQVALVRIEQLYPLNEEKLKEVIQQYAHIKEVMWVQEEHKNMGAWRYIYPYLSEILSDVPLKYVGRGVSATPATGSHFIHQKEYDQFINQVFSHEK